MMLNATRLNARSLNGGVRSGVFGAAEAITGFSGELDAIRIQSMNGAIVVPLASEFLASAQRYLTASAVVGLQSNLQQTVFKHGVADFIVDIRTGLHFAKVALGFGNAVIEVAAQGYIGVIFIDGQSVLHPMVVELDGTRKRQSWGVGAIAVEGALAPSAIRRTTGQPIFCLQGEGEGSHTDTLGTLYVGGSGDALFELQAEDHGMIRQLFLGSADMDLMAVGAGRLIRPTLQGMAPIQFGMEGDFFVLKYLQGTLQTGLVTELTGNRRRTGQGVLVTSLLSNGTGYLKKSSLGGDLVLNTGASLDGLKAVTLNGTMALETEVELGGAKKVLFKGNANIILFATSEGYTNIFGEDNPSQYFSRPAVIREFWRGSKTGTFTRTP